MRCLIFFLLDLHVQVRVMDDRALGTFIAGTKPTEHRTAAKQKNTLRVEAYSPHLPDAYNVQ